MILLVRLLGLASSLLISFFSSSMETAMYRVSRVRLRMLAEQGETRAPAVMHLLARLDAMVTTILICNNIAAYTGAYFVTAQLIHWRTPQAELVATVLVTPLFFTLTESLPKQLAYNRAEAFTLSLARSLAGFRLLLSPMVWILNHASALLRRAFGSRGEAAIAQGQRHLLLEYLSAGVADKVLSEEQNDMAARIMQLESISAGDCMIPRGSLVFLPEKTTRRRAMAEMKRRAIRMAILVDGSGRPTGRVATMNALTLQPGSPEDPVRDASEKLEAIRAGAAIPEVLNLFRRRHAHYALVVDRGQPAGLITVRRVLDRIAGINRPRTMRGGTTTSTSTSAPLPPAAL